MDSAPISYPDPVPADIDFDSLKEATPTEIAEIDDDEGYLPTNQTVAANLGRNQTLRQPSLSRCLEIQRVLYAAAMSSDTEPKDKAACARAWRDLEILRYAKQGKPLALNATMRVESKQARSSAPLAIVEVDQSSAA